MSPPENEDPELEVVDPELEVDPLVDSEPELLSDVLESVEVPVSEVTESVPVLLGVLESVSDVLESVPDVLESVSEALEALESVPEALEVLDPVFVPVSPPEVEVLVLTPVELVAPVLEVAPELLVVEVPAFETPELPLAEGSNAPSAKSES